MGVPQLSAEMKAAEPPAVSPGNCPIRPGPNYSKSQVATEPAPGYRLPQLGIIRAKLIHQGPGRQRLVIVEQNAVCGKRQHIHQLKRREAQASNFNAKSHDSMLDHCRTLVVLKMVCFKARRPC